MMQTPTRQCGRANMTSRAKKDVRSVAGARLLPATAGGLFIALTTGLLLGACGAVGNRTVNLGIPYRAQPAGSMYCGPAVVLMWRLYDGLPEISQDTIGAWMRTSYCTGSNFNRISAGVNVYTNTHDTQVDMEHADYSREYFSRQITSIDARAPVVALDGCCHVVIVNGGKWHRLWDGKYQWDYINFHDPDYGPNVQVAAGDWYDSNCGGNDLCEQIISQWASWGWEANFSTYGNIVQVNGFFCPDAPDQPICP